MYPTWTLVDIFLTMYVCLSVHVVCKWPLTNAIDLVIRSFLWFLRLWVEIISTATARWPMACQKIQNSQNKSSHLSWCEIKYCEVGPNATICS